MGKGGQLQCHVTDGRIVLLLGWRASTPVSRLCVCLIHKEIPKDLSNSVKARNDLPVVFPSARIWLNSIRPFPLFAKTAGIVKAAPVHEVHTETAVMNS
jgi:hypothetical protein